MSPTEQSVMTMAHRWWRAKRPLSFDLLAHNANPTINCATETEKNLAKAVAAALQERRERVVTPCLKCGGRGNRAYASTATWRGGAGGASVTEDVCDVCWGSGDTHRKGANLRAIEGELRALRSVAADLIAEAKVLLGTIETWNADVESIVGRVPVVFGPDRLAPLRAAIEKADRR